MSLDGKKESKQPPLIRREVDTTHDKILKLLWKIELEEHFPDKTPLNSIISLLQINLNSHIPLPSLRSTNGVK